MAINITGYEVTEELYTSLYMRVYRGIELQDNKKVILKLPRSEQPNNQEIMRLQHEYNLLEQLQLPGIIKAYNLIESKFTPILVLEDIQGVPLDAYLSSHPLTLESFFKIASQLVAIIASLHQKNVIHKDIKPANIIIEPGTLTIKLADLSISTQIIKENQELVNPEMLEGTLAYMSPEQTGRINLPIDYRSDFYSLGVTFFQMLTGKLPFDSNDALELVYCHIAKIPPSVSKINSEIPEMLATIVAKLMSKEPAQRYTRAFHLKDDLDECARQWKTYHKIKMFSLEHDDIQDKLQLSHKLYGREKQIAKLLKVFDHVSQGFASMMLVYGYSGIGKTSLIRVVHKPITKERGYFINGKFDQMQRSIPYSAIVAALRSLIKQVLVESEDTLLHLKQKLLTAVRTSGQVIIDIIPEVKMIIGPQPALPSLTPREAENRFHYVFQRFVQVFADKNHPLVIFLDDLQWADTASLKFIENLLLDPNTHHLLIIGAYRDNEVHASHPLVTMIKKLTDEFMSIHKLELHPLHLSDILHMINDIFKHASSPIEPFAALIENKTRGNPFFINEFLKTLYEKQLIYFSYEQARWHWDVTIIRQQDITDNVVDLLMAKIQRLAIPVQRTLKLSACLGQRFSLQTLATISKQNLLVTAQHLCEIMRANFILPLEGSYQTETVANLGTEHSIFIATDELHYRFVHDRIQQASYNLIPVQDRAAIHLDIVHTLLKEHPLKENDDRLFTLLDHLNQSLTLVTKIEEKTQFADYYCSAGKKAKIAMAYQAALAYFENALKLLSTNAWTSNYKLMFDIYQNYIECLYFLGDFDKANQHFQIVINKANSFLEKAQTYLIKITAYASIDDYQQAKEDGIEALRLFNFYIPKRVNSLNVLIEMAKLHYLIGRRSIANLDKEMKICDTAKDIMLQKLLLAIIAPILLSGDELMVGYLVCKAINISIVKGYTENSPSLLLIYANILIEKFGKIDLALQFVSLYEKLSAKVYSAVAESKNLLVIGYYIAPWRGHLRDSIKYFQKSFDLCMETGNLEYAAHNSAMYIAQFNVGTQLTTVSQGFNQALQFLRRLNNKAWFAFVALYQLIAKNLQGDLTSTNSEFEKIIAEVWQTNSKFLGISSYMRYSSFLFIKGEYKEALRFAKLFYDQRQHLKGITAISVGLLYYALSMTRNYATATNKEKHLYRKDLKKIKKQMQLWADYCPANLQFMYFWICAEIARLQDNIKDSAAYYDKAIISAQENGYVNYVAMISESAADFCLDMKQMIWAKSYIQIAYYAYERWGAHYKSQTLIKKYGDWLSTPNSESNIFSMLTSGTHKTVTLDFKSIIKSSQALSSEIHIEKLVAKLLQIALENAGAQLGAVLFQKQDQLVVVSEGDIEHPINVDLRGVPLEKTNLPKSIISYVQRTQDNLLLNEPNAMEQFQQDPYFLSNHPKSIMCVPILRQGNVSGYLYLENRLISHAFTEDRLKVLRLLAGQTAISLENAKLYSATSRFVPYELLRQINRSNLTEVQLGDQIQQEMTILFCDIRNFTAFSETLSPAQVFQFINRFLYSMQPIITKNHGFVDKYIGDAIMALFNNPDDAIQAALDILNALVDFNRSLGNTIESSVKVGIGINTGELMLGIIGDQNRMEGSVLGDAVNVASRIQGLTKEYNTDLLISDTTKAKVKPGLFNFKAVGEVAIRGKKQPVLIWMIE